MRLLFFILVIVILVIILSASSRENFNECNYPSHIVIIRHGEKPPNKRDFFLDGKGKDRAYALIDWVRDVIPRLIGKSINAIYTPDPGPFSEDSRPRQTISLAAFNNNIAIMGKYRYFETEKAAEEVLCNSYLQDKAVLICWEHTCIQKLIDSLQRKGYDEKSIPFWQSNDFSTVVIMTKNNGKYDLSYSCENLLADDISICSQKPIVKEQMCTTY